MDKYKYVVNAEVSSCDIKVDRGFILSLGLCVNYDGGHQCIPAFSLGGLPGSDAKIANHRSQKNIMAEFVGKALEVLDVESLSKAKGRIIRVAKDGYFDTIKAIGHPCKDVWLDFDEIFKGMVDKNEN